MKTKQFHISGDLSFSVSGRRVPTVLGEEAAVLTMRALAYPGEDSTRYWDGVIREMPVGGYYNGRVCIIRLQDVE